MCCSSSLWVPRPVWQAHGWVTLACPCLPPLQELGGMGRSRVVREDLPAPHQRRGDGSETDGQSNEPGTVLSVWANRAPKCTRELVSQAQVETCCPLVDPIPLAMAHSRGDCHSSAGTELGPTCALQINCTSSESSSS